jgi:hypothetical protein
MQVASYSSYLVGASYAPISPAFGEMWEMERISRPKRFGRYRRCISPISPKAGEIGGSHGRGWERDAFVTHYTSSFDMISVRAKLPPNLLPEIE